MALEFRVTECTVHKWVKRFRAEGVAGLTDPAREEGSCMDPTRFPHAPHPLAPDSQTACERTR